MKKWIVLLALLATLTFAAACGGDETVTTEVPTATESAPTAPEPTSEPVEVPTGMYEVSPVPIEEIVNITWQWAEMLESEPASQSVVPEPEKYSLVLWEDNRFDFQADCNFGGGSYAVDGSKLTFELGPITLASCGPDSLHDQYLFMLAHVTGFGMLDDRLVLVTDEGAGQMVYNNGGAAEKPEPPPESCANIDMGSVQFDTMGLSDSWQANCVPTIPYDSSQPPGPTGLPEHIQIIFGDSGPEAKQPGDPVVYIIPVEPYKLMYESNGDQSVTNSIGELQTLLVDQPEPIPTSGMPVLPYEEVGGVNDISVQGEYLNIPMGSGVRFVGRFMQDANPVTNQGMRYIYQGFTDDGTYLISYFYPVTTDALPDGAENVSEDEQEQVNTDVEGYLAGKASELNGLSASDWEPDLTTLDAVIDSLVFEYEAPDVPVDSAPSLTNINWQWTELVETDPAGQSLVPNPEGYVLIFLVDGRVDILADCNFGNGTYTLDGDNIAIAVEAMTEIACDAGSLSDQFVNLLSEVVAYELTTPRLTLNLNEDAGRMSFANGGQALIPPVPGEDVPTATTTEPVNVRSGPGTAYTSFGIVPAATTFEVTGVSEDGTWWVVKLPTDVALSGQGWINANYVETENTENVPVIPAPPLDGGGTPPGTDVPTATALEPINVRSGPGTAYPSYGVAPIGATAVVVGVSEDGQWWVIQVPTDIAPDGRGWVNGNYVEVTNAENVPIVEAPPLP